VDSNLFRDGDYLIEDAQDLVQRVEERFAKQRASEALANVKVCCWRLVFTLKCHLGVDLLHCRLYILSKMISRLTAKLIMRCSRYVDRSQPTAGYTHCIMDLHCFQAAVDEAIDSGNDENDPMIKMAQTLLTDLKDEYDAMMAKKAKEEQAKREKLAKARCRATLSWRHDRHPHVSTNIY